MARYWEWDAPFTIHPEETALLIIDMQTGFTQPDGPLYTPSPESSSPPSPRSRNSATKRASLYSCPFLRRT